MIHHLMHARLGGGSLPYLINPPIWQGVTYASFDYVEGGAAVSTATFTIKSDGTFEFSGSSGTAGGNWRTEPTAGVGSGYEVRFSIIETFGSGAITNGASSFSLVSVNRAFSLVVTQSVFGTAFGQRKVLVEIKPVGGLVEASGWFIVESSAEVGFAGGGGDEAPGGE